MDEVLKQEKEKVPFFLKIKNKAIEIWNDKTHLFWYIGFLLLVALAFFFTTLIRNQFTLPLSGDYCLQQIPFYTNGYDDWWTFIKTGKFPMWDHSTFLGANNIGSNTFYYLLNPFFLPILLWPRDYIAQGLATLMIIKMVLAGVSFRAYLKYVGLQEKTARLFALAYAFCGWNVFYLWFNHFLEVCVVFPLILMGIEKVIREKKPWLLMASLGLMGLCNYFFLVSSCFCGVCYAVYRYFVSWKDKSPKDRASIIGIGVGAFLVGIMIGAVTLYPAYAVVTSSSRVQNASFLDTLREAWDAKKFKLFFDTLFKFDSEKKKYYPLMSFLFPTISDYSSILFNNRGYDNTLCSLFIYTPLMMFFVPSVLQSIRKKRIHHLVAIAFFILTLFTPFFYYLCYGFTLDYGRWQIFAVASILVFIAQNYEERKEMPAWYFDVSIGAVLIGVIIVVSYALSIQNDTSKYVYPLGDRVYVVVGEVIYMFVCYFYLRFKYNKKGLTQMLMGVVAIEAVVMGTLTFSYQPPNKYSEVYGGLANVMEEEKIIREIQKQDDSFYRIFNTNSDRNSNNLAMREGYKGVSAFHSLYNYNVTDFVQWSRIGYSYMNWSMGVHEKRINLDTFLNVKYYIQKTIQKTGADGNKIISNNIPFGFEEMPELESKDHKVYRNTNYIELGFAFDTVMNEESMSAWNNIDRNEMAYLSSAILSEEDMAKAQEKAPNLTEKKFSSIPDLKSVTTSGTQSYPREQERYQQYYQDVKEKNPSWSDAEIQEYILNTYKLDINKYQDISIKSNDRIYNYTYGTTLRIRPQGSNRIASDASDENPYYINLHLRMGENAMVRFYDLEGKEIVWDNHMWHYYDASGDWKYDRGFYVNREVGEIEIIIYANASSATSALDYPRISFESYNSFKERIQALKGENDENLFQNIKVTDNTIDFDTNYETKKIIVLSIPYDEGWSGTYTTASNEKKPLEIYKAQGGFLSFVAEEGMTHYSLDYFTPNLKEGLLLCASGIIIFASSWGAVYAYEKKKKKEQQVVNNNENA